ncbi:MAG TPA: CoA ester lyase [Terracidiphilus sp.]|nr:CoA ester lyase [Terracidiphilus sp.]
MRSKLFVPAVRPDLFVKALGTAADAICFDLEDAVPAERKAEARSYLETLFSASPSKETKYLLVRTNPAGSPEFLSDLNAVVRPGLFAIALPKVEVAEDIHHAVKLLSQLETERGIPSPIALLVTVESPRGLRNAHALATASERIVGLQLGFADLLEPLGIASEDAMARQQIRLMLRLAAGEAGVPCYEAAYPLFRDSEGFLVQLRSARALGFAGASCIHPSQIEAVNSVFTPTAQEIAHAQAVLAAAEEAERTGSAVVALNGKMIDRPFVLRAKATLSRKH